MTVFIICKSQEQLEMFKKYLNSKHTTIIFTSEMEEERKLPFLYMLIDRNNGKITTSVYIRNPHLQEIACTFIVSSPVYISLASSLRFSLGISPFVIFSTLPLGSLPNFKKIYEEWIFIENYHVCIHKYLRKTFEIRMTKDTRGIARIFKWGGGGGHPLTKRAMSSMGSKKY